LVKCCISSPMSWHQGVQIDKEAIRGSHDQSAWKKNVFKCTFSLKVQIQRCSLRARHGCKLNVKLLHTVYITIVERGV
jgi:hypothetical protein